MAHLIMEFSQEGGFEQGGRSERTFIYSVLECYEVLMSESEINQLSYIQDMAKNRGEGE